MIDLVPDIKSYPFIWDAHKNDKLVVFVGAGLSSIWGCKRWKDMAASLVQDCYELGKIDYWTRENLLARYSLAPRKLLTITKSVLEDKYIGCLNKTLEVSNERKNKYSDLFEIISSLNAIFVTTNIDTHLSGQVKKVFGNKNVHVDVENFKKDVLKPKNLFHLHGVIDKPDSLVMTIDEYIRRYKNDSFKNFLELLFFGEDYRVLFIGYGMDEMEIIDFMIEKYSEDPRASRNLIHRFYILLPFFQNEERLLEYEKSYLKKLEVTPIAYSIDSNGYDQLAEVVKIWKENLTRPMPGDDFYEFTSLIERV